MATPRTAQSETPRRTMLRYFGGKWNMAPTIIRYFPKHRVYCEPFAGGASILLRKPRSYAEVINDLDRELVNVFRVMQDPESAAELGRLLRFTPFAREEFELSYEPTDDPVEWARRTIIRSFMGFGSDGVRAHQRTGFRANGNRNGTTPARDWETYPDHLSIFCARLRGVVIEHRPAVEVIRQQDSPKTLHYLDPPYPTSTRGCGGHKHGYAQEMTDQEHRDLAELVHRVEGMVIVSGYRCELYDELYADWVRVDFGTHSDGARDRVESLWLSPRTAEAGQGRLFKEEI